MTRTAPARQARSAPARDLVGAESQAAQVEDVGPDPSKPAEVAIQAKRKARSLIQLPPPTGNPRDQFRELAPQHGVLVGMRVGYVNAFGGSKVAMIQPIFQDGDAYVDGKQLGASIAPSVTVVARPGYAIGAINTRTGLLVDAFQIVFMRFKAAGRLDTADSYTSEWLGDARGGNPATASGGGKLVVGVHGRSNGREVNALGLVVAE